MLIPDWLSRRAADLPAAPALIVDDQTWSFAALAVAAIKLAHDLQAQGVQAGDRVAVLMNNGAPFVITIHALIQLGAIMVPLNTRLTLAELVWQLDDVGAIRLLTDASQSEMATALHRARPELAQSTVSATSPSSDAVCPLLREQLDLDAPHCIIYTSGTTGRPKGVLLSYANHWWSAIGSALNLGHQAHDRWLLVLPLFHVGGLAIVLRSVIAGLPLVVQARFDPVAVNTAIETHAITLVSVVATMLDRMLSAQVGSYPPSLRAVLLGGGPAPQPLLERCAALALPVIQTYGMTETASQAVTLAPADTLRKLGSAGKPLLPVAIRISSAEVDQPPFTVGEIVVRGPNVTAGYVDRPEATAQVLRDGWLHTGDLGYLDAEGFLFVVDRRDDLIISGGENVYPAEVEAILLAHPAVIEAGVVGQPDAVWGQLVVAAVVLDPASSVTPAELIAFCASQLARYKVPRTIMIQPSLPRTASGKLLRRELRANVLNRQDAKIS